MYAAELDVKNMPHLLLILKRDLRFNYHYPDNEPSDLAFAFAPDIFNVLLLASLRSDLCPPQQNLHVSNLKWWQTRLP